MGIETFIYLFIFGILGAIPKDSKSKHRSIKFEHIAGAPDLIFVPRITQSMETLRLNDR